MSRKADLKRLGQLADKDWHKLSAAEREEEAALCTRPDAAHGTQGRVTSGPGPADI
jgi:hypothetical protein